MVNSPISDRAGVLPDPATSAGILRQRKRPHAPPALAPTAMDERSTDKQ
jgi:hypothetical protein